MQVGDILGGFGDEDGITLHTLGPQDGEMSSVSIIHYKPDDENFAWAIEQLASLQET